MRCGRGRIGPEDQAGDHLREGDRGERDDPFRAPHHLLRQRDLVHTIGGGHVEEAEAARAGGIRHVPQIDAGQAGRLALQEAVLQPDRQQIAGERVRGDRDDLHVNVREIPVGPHITVQAPRNAEAAQQTGVLSCGLARVGSRSAADPGGRANQA
jgi:hypothetical protein